MKSTTKAPAKAPAKPAAAKAPAKGTAAKAAPAKKPAAKTADKKEEKPAAVIEETKQEVVKDFPPKKEYPKIPDKQIETLMDDFRTIVFLKLDNYLNAAALSQKYCILFDETGKIPDFLTYKGVHKDIHKDMVNYKLGLKEKDEVFEVLRSGLVVAMRLGGNFGINIDRLDDVQWEAEWTKDEFFPMTVFDSDEWREEENYRTVVRPEEDKGFMDNDELVEQRFEMKEKFNLVIVCHFDGDLQSLYRITKLIPFSDFFSKFIVKDMTKEEAMAADAKRKATGEVDDALKN